MGRDKLEKASKKNSGRDGGSFVALPWSVLDCPAYSLLSHPARSLLLEFARQYVRDNNGRLLASGRHLSKRGWKSSDVILRAKRELLDAGFIYETVKGCRPNKASWYAITWQNLDKNPNYDYGAWEGWKKARSGYRINTLIKNTSLTPSQGVEMSTIAPSNDIEGLSTTPSGGAIKPFLSNTLHPLTETI
jgi:hypothetical protein